MQVDVENRCLGHKHSKITFKKDYVLKCVCGKIGGEKKAMK